MVFEFRPGLLFLCEFAPVRRFQITEMNRNNPEII